MSSEEFRFVIFTGDIHFLNRKTCDFCDEDFPDVKALNEHLIQCGNKTELCPRCRKYIRRVEFVNHYENNCANLEDRPSIEKSKPTSQSSGSLIDTIPCEFCEQSCPFNEYDQHSVRILKKDQLKNLRYSYRELVQVIENRLKKNRAQD